MDMVNPITKIDKSFRKNSPNLIILVSSLCSMYCLGFSWGLLSRVRCFTHINNTTS